MINRDIKIGETPMSVPAKAFPKTQVGKPAEESTPKDKFMQARKEDVSLLPGKMTAQAVDDSEPVEKFPRPMNDNEKTTFKRWFPKLDVDKSKVTAESTYKYNCISWTVGETNQWFWPPSMYPDNTERGAFDKFYARYSYKPAESGEVARWRNKDGLTHGCVVYREDSRWESKCGAAARITHDLNGLEGEVYGSVDGFYKLEGERKMPGGDPIKVPDSIKDAVVRDAENVPPHIRKDFEKNYKEWVEFRNKPDVQFLSRTSDHCKTESFDNITKMGPKVLPLLMEKMGKGDFFCLEALNAIKDSTRMNRRMLKDLELTKEELVNSEQSKSALVLKKWHKFRGM